VKILSCLNVTFISIEILKTLAFIRPNAFTIARALIYCIAIRFGAIITIPTVMANTLTIGITIAIQCAIVELFACGFTAVSATEAFLTFANIRLETCSPSIAIIHFIASYTLT
jgi:hypothetical protein